MPDLIDVSRPGEFPFSSYLVQRDAVDLLFSLRPGSVDCIFTDCAFESLEKHRYGAESCRRLRDENWFAIFKNDRLPFFFQAAYQCLAKNSHFYFMCDEDTLHIAKPLGEAAGFKYWKSVIWDRGVRGQGYHYANTHEFVLFFEKGKKQLNDRKHISIVRHIPRELSRKKYPTEKPVPLIKYFLENSTRPGRLVVDPFCGSGNSGLAALALGCDYIGGDTSARAMAEASKRLALFHQYQEVFGG